MLLHLPEQIRWWGALRETWLYSFERANGEMVNQTMSSRKRTRQHPEKAMSRKVQAMMILRTAAIQEPEVTEAINAVFPPVAVRNRRVPIVELPVHVIGDY